MRSAATVTATIRRSLPARIMKWKKVLYAADELTGLIGAAAKMRPSRSCQDMEVSSLKKKFKDKRFAAGCSPGHHRPGCRAAGLGSGRADGADDPGHALL